MNKKILLIDDDEDERLIFTEALKETGAAVNFFYAPSAEEGLKLLERSMPDLIFLDINMPAINGLECLDRIKKMMILSRCR